MAECGICRMHSCISAVDLRSAFWGSEAALGHISGMINTAVCSTGVFLLCSEVPVGKSVLGTDSTGPEELVELRDAQEEGSW